EVLIGVTERDRGGVGNAEQETGEVVAHGLSGERERSTRILLREQVELLPAVVGDEGHVMRAVVPEHVLGDAGGLVACERTPRIEERLESVREVDGRRTPVDRLLVIAVD